MRIVAKAVGVLTMALSLMAGGAWAQDADSPARPVTPPGALPSVLGTPALGGNGSVELTSGTYAVFHTSEGDFIAELHPEWAPQAVSNFTALATGQKEWRHPVTLLETTRPLYSNTTIYRTVPNSMIFGGDPINRGEGDSGTLLPLETSPEVQFSEAGLLAMDGSGSKMSGSRWFITLRPFPERTGNYTVFGKVIGGLDLVQRISLKPVKRPQLPLDPVMIYFVEVIRIPAGRMTTGEFRMEEGLKVLRIDPDFKDAPIQTAAPVTEVEETTETVVADDQTTPAEEADADEAEEDASEDSDSDSE